MSRVISVEGDTVIKIQEPRASRRERLRTMAGREVSQRTGLFLVPDILSYDDERGEIVFERLAMTTFREALSRSGRGKELVTGAGRALAAIHRQMAAAPDPLVSPPGQWGAREGRLVPLHGDFGMRNVFCLSSTDQLAVIDWANSDWMGFDADLGPPEVDLAVFLMSLFRRRVFGPMPIARRHDLARYFLQAYALASPYGVDLEVLRKIVSAAAPSFHQQALRERGYLRALGYRHNIPDLSFFLRRLSGTHYAQHGRSQG